MTHTEWARTEDLMLQGIHISKLEELQVVPKAAPEIVRLPPKVAIEKDRRLNIAMRADLILEIVCSVFSVKPEDVRSRRRSHDLVVPRQIVWKILRDRGWSYPQIAGYFYAHHTSVIHGTKSLGMKCRRQPDLNMQVQILSNRLTCSKEELVGRK